MMDHTQKKIINNIMLMGQMIEDIKSDKQKLIQCLEFILPSVEHVGVIDYINRTLEEVKK